MTDEPTAAAPHAERASALAERIRQIKVGETAVIDGRSYWRTGPHTVDGGAIDDVAARHAAA